MLNAQSDLKVCLEKYQAEDGNVEIGAHFLINIKQKTVFLGSTFDFCDTRKKLIILEMVIDY